MAAMLESCVVFILLFIIDGVRADGLPTGAIIGIAAASFIFVKLIVVLSITCYAKSKRVRQQREAEERVARAREEQLRRVTTISQQAEIPHNPWMMSPVGQGYPADMGEFAPPPYSQIPTSPNSVLPPGESTAVIPFNGPPPEEFQAPPRYEDIITKDLPPYKQESSDVVNESVPD